MSPLEEELLELEGSLNEARISIEWISEHYDIDAQFLRHHVRSALHEIRYLQAQEETPS